MDTLAGGLVDDMAEDGVGAEAGPGAGEAGPLACVEVALRENSPMRRPTNLPRAGGLPKRVVGQSPGCVAAPMPARFYADGVCVWAHLCRWHLCRWHLC